MVAAAIYARISEDDTGQEKGVTRQIDDARQLATSRGWDVVHVYTDNDVSAYSGRPRPEYIRLMDDVQRGLFQRIIAYQPSRLWRRRSERVAAIEMLSKLAVGVTCVRGPELDFSSSYGRSMAVMLGEFDSMESEVKSERVIDAARQRAQEGRANGPVLYGWRRVYDSIAKTNGRVVKLFHDEVDDEEAGNVREIVDRLLAGDTLRSVAADFNARNLPTPKSKEGRTWKHTTVRKLALRPANVGLRVYHRQVLGKAAWTPIVDQDKHDRVTALLTAPVRQTSERKARPGARKFLLTYGVGVCGVCGAELRVKPIRSGSRRYNAYVCDTPKGCVGRSHEKVDELVGDLVVARLGQPDAAGFVAGDDEDAQKAREVVEALRARLDNAADAFASGDIDREQLKRITAALRPDLEKAEADVRRHRPVVVPDAVEHVLNAPSLAAWESLTVTQKRTVLELLGLRVIIMPRKKSGPGFDPEEIKFVWPEGAISL